jgi:hypothetical protein
VSGSGGALRRQGRHGEEEGRLHVPSAHRHATIDDWLVQGLSIGNPSLDLLRQLDSGIGAGGRGSSYYLVEAATNLGVSALGTEWDDSVSAVNSRPCPS